MVVDGGWHLVVVVFCGLATLLLVLAVLGSIFPRLDLEGRRKSVLFYGDIDCYPSAGAFLGMPKERTCERSWLGRFM